MQSKGAIAAMVVVGGLATAAFLFMPEQGVPTLKTGSKAPNFSGTTLDGMTVSLAEATKNGAAYLYFVKSDCPINADALPHFKGIAAAYKGEGSLIAVINESKEDAKSWSADNRANFKLLPDPNGDVIRAYQAKASPWVVEVKKDGTVGRIWNGFSKSALQEINQAVAAAAGAQVAKIDFSSAPGSMRYG